jgi:hypothetical protein
MMHVTGRLRLLTGNLKITTKLNYRQKPHKLNDECKIYLEDMCKVKKYRIHKKWFTTVRNGKKWKDIKNETSHNQERMTGRKRRGKVMEKVVKKKVIGRALGKKKWKWQTGKGTRELLWRKAIMKGREIQPEQKFAERPE